MFQCQRNLNNERVYVIKITIFDNNICNVYIFIIQALTQHYYSIEIFYQRSSPKLLRVHLCYKVSITTSILLTLDTYFSNILTTCSTLIHINYVMGFSMAHWLVSLLSDPEVPWVSWVQFPRSSHTPIRRRVSYCRPNVLSHPFLMHITLIVQQI